MLLHFIDLFRFLDLLIFPINCFTQINDFNHFSLISITLHVIGIIVSLKSASIYIFILEHIYMYKVMFYYHLLS